MKKNIKELELYDLDEIITEVEEHAIEVENNLLKLYAEVPAEP
jgi:hypothetical protein